MRHRLLTLIVLAALALTPGTTPPASARVPFGELHPLAFQNLSPPIGTSFVYLQPSISWSMTATPNLDYVSVSISSSPAVGADGHTLADLDRSAFILMFPATTNGSVYKSFGGVPSYLSPGTYFWQMDAVKMNANAEYESAIYSFVVLPHADPAPPVSSPPSPQSPPASHPPVRFTQSQAISMLGPLILRETHHKAYSLHKKCLRANATVFRCTVSWRTTPGINSHTLVYIGAIIMRRGPTTTRYSFAGVRGSSACLKRGSAARCAKKVRW